MADYQMGGGYIEGETPEEYQRRMEEERRRQEALNAPVKQTIVTNADGSQEVTVKGTPEALSSANPNTPTLMQPGQPVAPDESAAETQRLQRQAQFAQGVPVAPQGLGDRLGQAGTNFSNNLSRGMTNMQNAPENFVRNMGQLPQFGPGVQTASINPDAAFQRMLQVESGNRDYTTQGTPMTSPKGAMFAAQVLPTTAQNPGYGVRPATAQTPEEYNRVGQEYYSAMLKKYNGDENMARAAYNAGPGRVDQAIAQGRAQGVDPVTLLPRETQDYIKKTAAPAAGVQVASTAPGAGISYQMASETGRPAVPVPQLGENPMYGLPTQGGQGLRMPGVGAGQPSASASAIERYQSIQDKPDELMKFAFSSDTSTPDFLKQRAKDQIAEGYSQQKNLVNAQKEIGNLTPKQAADALQGRGKAGVGDWMQYLLLKHVGLSDLANQKGEELGIGHKWTQSTISDTAGNDIAVELQTTASGKVLSGNRLDGTPLTAKELNLAGGAIGKKLNLVGGTYVNDKTGEVGRVVSDEKTGRSYVQTDAGRKPMAGFRPQASGGSLEQQGATQLQKLRNDLQFKGPEAAAKALGEFDAMNGTRYLDQYKQNAPQFFQSIGMAPPGSQAAGSGAGAGAGGAPAATAVSTAVATASPADITSGKKVTEAERVQFVEKVLPDINKKGDDGRYVADTRRTQVAMLTGPNSAIMGIYRGTGTEYDKARSVLRDAIAGTYSGKEGGERFSEALRGISIPAPEMSALKEFAQMNTGINAKTLAENAGEGPKSDADIKLNQAANMSNIGDLPAFAALSGLTRSQFAGDVNKRKQDFVVANRDKYQTQSQVEAAWSKEKDTLNRQYEGIYKERLNFVDAKMVEKFGKDWRKRPDNETQGFYRDASIHSFNVLPTPNYNVQSGMFEYPTQQSKLAAMRAITGK